MTRNELARALKRARPDEDHTWLAVDSKKVKRRLQRELRKVRNKRKQRRGYA